MDSVKQALRGIPRPQPGEAPASENQLGYLRSFGLFSEKNIKGLGKWQASYLIDKALEIRGETPPDSKRKGGCVSSLLKLIIGLIAIVVVFKVITSGLKNSSPVTDKAKPATITPPQLKETAPPAQANVTPPANVPPPAPPATKNTSNITGVIQNLESTSLPIKIETVEEISILDKTGKETSIPVGVVLMIDKRASTGTLELTRNGEYFVGNESRLLGKVKAVK